MPSELLSLFGSSLFGSLMRVWSFSTIARHRERLLALHRREVSPGAQDTPRSPKYFGASWTRRLIALTAVFFVIAFPKLLAVWRPDLSISIGYPQMETVFYSFRPPAKKFVGYNLKVWSSPPSTPTCCRPS
ncbi:MAG: hypothetical protein LBR62_02480 [Puniceicoccales bacterium]|nr:hypothetical protein [Puniceicoccales bacterium]